MGIKESWDNFILQSTRVFQITHKPKKYEFEHIALSTGLGMAFIGIIGYLVAIISTILRSAR